MSSKNTTERSDGNEPITEEWLESVGFDVKNGVATMAHTKQGDLVVTMRGRCYLEIGGPKGIAFAELRAVSNRDDVRRVCMVLGMDIIG